MNHCENGHAYSDVIHKECPACLRGDKPVFGVALHTLHRKDAPDTSVAAARKIDTATDEKRVYEIISFTNFGEGMTLKEIARQMKKQSNQISGRITALLKKGLVKDSGERREGCRVIVRVSA